MGTRVKVLENGLWSINPPNPGELRVIEGQERDDIPQQLIDRMLASKAVKVIKAKASAEDQETTGAPETPESSGDSPPDSESTNDVSDIRATLIDIIDGSDNKNDAKDKLEVWARENLDYEVDKRRSCENVVADIIAVYEA